MSAFIVTGETMARAVQGICAVIETFHGIGTASSDAPGRIGRLLYSMNIEAVTQRYPDCDATPQDLPGPCDDAGN